MPATRNTVQRHLVLNAAQSLRHHPTAEDIYRHIAKTYPSVSLATVYRNLTLLAESGQLLRVCIPGTADRFDFTLSPHHHFLCRGCGGVFDIDAPPADALLQQAQLAEGFSVEQCEVSFKGLCPSCSGKQ